MWTHFSVSFKTELSNLSLCMCTFLFTANCQPKTRNKIVGNLNTDCNLKLFSPICLCIKKWRHLVAACLNSLIIPRGSLKRFRKLAFESQEPLVIGRVVILGGDDISMSLKMIPCNILVVESSICVVIICFIHCFSPIQLPTGESI